MFTIIETPSVPHRPAFALHALAKSPISTAREFAHPLPSCSLTLHMSEHYITCALIALRKIAVFARYKTMSSESVVIAHRCFVTFQTEVDCFIISTSAIFNTTLNFDLTHTTHNKPPDTYSTNSTSHLY